YNFEWDPGKAGVNTRKHGVSFEQAAEVFLDPLQLATFDDSEVEERWVTLGKAKDGNLLVVVHTFEEQEDDATVRIISARKATKHEQRQYEES
ncbi:MAG: BrnT family toxin, partial [Gammaproteobacteria bacterium]